MSSPPEFENTGARRIGAGDSAYLLGERFQIGHDPTNDLQPEDQEVCRFHAAIQRLNDGQYWIADLISRNGTRVKGESLKGSSQRLEHGDRLRIGDHWFDPHCGRGRKHPNSASARSTEFPASFGCLAFEPEPPEAVS